MDYHTATIKGPDASLVLYSREGYCRATLDNGRGYVTARCWCHEGKWAGDVDWQIGPKGRGDITLTGNSTNETIVPQSIAAVFLSMARKLLESTG